MQKNTKSSLTIFSFFLLLCLASIPNSARALIVDHTSAADFENIPDSAIQQAKNNFKIDYGHGSHGGQLITGTNMLQGQIAEGAIECSNYSPGNNIYQYCDDYRSQLPEGVLSLWSMRTWPEANNLANPDRTAWYYATRRHLDDPNNNRNLVMWSWSGHGESSTEADINSYLSLMSQLETDYPNIKFVYMTITLSGTGANGNGNQRNEQIRNFVRGTDRILYDYADIESYDPSGGEYMTRLAGDSTRYDANNSGSQWDEEVYWAREWCNSHPEEINDLCAFRTPPNVAVCAHSDPLNCNLKARAFWWMLARLAGWQGNLVPDTIAPTVSIVSPINDSSIFGVVNINATATDNIKVAGVQFKLDGSNLGNEDVSSPYSVNWNTTTATYGPHILSVTARDAAGNIQEFSINVNVDNTAPDTTAPTLTDAFPSGVLVTGTRQATISLITNENAICRYSTIPNIPYSSMTNNFLTTGNLDHSQPVIELADGTLYNYYVRCADASGNVSTDDYLITFNVAAPIPSPSNGNITFDSSNSASVPGNSNLATLTWSHTVGSGSDRILLVGVSTGIVSPNRQVTSVTYNGLGLTRLGTSSYLSNSNVMTQTQLWYLLNPPTGTGNITFTWSGTLKFVAGSASYFGVNQTTPFGQLVSNNGRGGTASIGGISASTNDLVFDLFSRESDALTYGTPTASTTQTEIWNVRTNTTSWVGDGVIGGSSNKMNSSNMSWNWGPTRSWSILAVPMKATLISGGGDTTAPTLNSGFPSGTLVAGTKQTTISLITDENATCRYSTTPNTLYSSMTNTFLTTGNLDHSQPVIGLSDGQTYNYYVRCVDALGNANAEDYIINFSVMAPVDTESPNVSITSLSDGSVLVGSTLIQVIANDNVAIAGIQLRVDGVSVGVEDINAPYDFALDTRTLTNGAHSISVTARDTSGNTNQATVSVTVDNPIIQGITFDSASSDSSGGLRTTSIDWSHTVGSGSNRILIVGVSQGYGLNPSVTSVTYDGVPLTRLTERASLSGTYTYARQEIWYLSNPNPGTASVVVNQTTTGPIVANALSYSGVDQVNPFGTISSNGNVYANNISTTVTSNSGEVVIDFLVRGGDIDSMYPPVPGVGQTLRSSNRTNNQKTTSTGITGATSEETGATSVPMTWSPVTPNTSMVIVSVPIRPN